MLWCVCCQLSSFSSTLCYSLKRKLQFMRLFLSGARKTSIPNYLEFTRVHAEILPLSGQYDLLPRIVNFVFWIAYSKFKVISSVNRHKYWLQCYCNSTTLGSLKLLIVYLEYFDSSMLGNVEMCSLFHKENLRLRHTLLWNYLSHPINFFSYFVDKTEAFFQRREKQFFTGGIRRRHRACGSDA